MKKKVIVQNSTQGYDLAAAEYDKKESYLNSFEQGAVAVMLGDVRGKKILDVGAGTGRLAIPLQQQGADVTALDVSAEMLRVLQRKNKKVTTVVGEAEALPFADQSFAIVTAAFLVVHLKNPTRFFDEVYRVLTDNGVFLLTNINQKKPPEISTGAGKMVIESFYHRPEQVRAQLEELAFSIEEEKIIRENGVWINQILRVRK